MAFDDKKIPDPLAEFYNEGPSVQAGVKNPVTGIREETDTAHKQKIRQDEGKRKEDIAKRAITRLMQDDIGREWLYDELHSCNVFGTPFTADPILTAYNSGALWRGKLLEAQIKKYALSNYLLMLEEALQHEELWNEKAADK